MNSSIITAPGIKLTSSLTLKVSTTAPASTALSVIVEAISGSTVTVGFGPGGTILSTSVALSGTRTLVSTSDAYQFINPSANSTVVMPAAVKNMAFVLKNVDSSGFVLTVKDSSGTALSTIVNSQSLLFLHDGSSWQQIG